MTKRGRAGLGPAPTGVRGIASGIVRQRRTLPVDPTSTVSLTSIPQNGQASYTYDGDVSGLCTPERSERGTMVKSVIGEVTTCYVNAGYEKKVK